MGTFDSTFDSTFDTGVGVPTLTKVTIAPAAPTVIAGQSQQATATATYSDLSTADVTSSAIWAASSPSIASVGSRGLISGVSAGSGPVTATLGVSAYPTTAAALTSAVGFGTWSGGYLFEDISGNAKAAFGGIDLIPQSSPTYLQPGPLGAGDYAIGFDSSGDGFSAGNNYNPGTGDICFAIVAKLSAAQANAEVLYKYFAGAQYQLRVISGAYRIDLDDGAGHTLNLAVSTAIPIGVWHVAMFAVDRAAGTARVAFRALDGSVSGISSAGSVSSIGSLTSTAGWIIGGGTTGTPTSMTIAAAYIGAGAGVAVGMSAGLATACTNLAACLMGSAVTTVAPYLSSIDHTLAALSRLPSQFQKPKIQNLIRALTSPANELEQAMWAVLTQRSITNAIGAQLDVIGGIVGQDRNGLSDDDYRRYISARVIAERSRGNVEDVYTIAVLIVGDASVTFALTEDGTATCRLTVKGPITDGLAAILFTFERLAIEAGVRIILEWSTVPLAATFTLDTGPGLDSGRLASQLG